MQITLKLYSFRPAWWWPSTVRCQDIRTLPWRHNEHDCVSNHQPYDCLLNRLFSCRSKKISKLHVTGLCAGNSPVIGEFPARWPVTRKMFPFDDVIIKQSDEVPPPVHTGATPEGLLLWSSYEHKQIFISFDIISYSLNPIWKRKTRVLTTSIPYKSNPLNSSKNIWITKTYSKSLVVNDSLKKPCSIV